VRVSKVMGHSAGRNDRPLPQFIEKACKRAYSATRPSYPRLGLADDVSGEVVLERLLPDSRTLECSILIATASLHAVEDRTSLMKRPVELIAEPFNLNEL